MSFFCRACKETFFSKRSINWNRMMSYIEDIDFPAYFKVFLQKCCFAVCVERQPGRDVFCLNFTECH